MGVRDVLYVYIFLFLVNSTCVQVRVQSCVYGKVLSACCFSGPPSEDNEDTFTHELRGIIPRSFEYLFSFINRNKQKVKIISMYVQ